MAADPCLYHWHSWSQWYLDTIPLGAVREQLQRAVKEILRWSDDHGNEWTSHEQVRASIRLRERYNVLGPHHVHAIIVDCNRDHPVFDVFHEWTTSEPWRLVKYWYKARPGTCPVNWVPNYCRKNTDISKRLAVYLRKDCRRKPVPLDQVFQQLRADFEDLTLEALVGVISADPGRYSMDHRYGDTFICARPAHCYRKNLPSLDKIMEHEVYTARP